MLLGLPSFSKVFTGEISKDLKKDVNQVIDAENNTPIEGVIIKIPSKNYQTKTQKDGTFRLGTNR